MGESFDEVELMNIIDRTPGEDEQPTLEPPNEVTFVPPKPKDPAGSGKSTKTNTILGKGMSLTCQYNVF
jgi:hypothetical protein